MGRRNHLCPRLSTPGGGRSGAPGGGRLTVSLPGYQLLECNVPSQVLSEPDGRVGISFMHQAPGEAALIIRAKPGAQTGAVAKACV